MDLRNRFYGLRNACALRQTRWVVLAAAVQLCVSLPVSAQAPQPPQLTPGADIFGEEVTLTTKTIVYVTGKANWDNALPTLKNNFKTLTGFLSQQKLQAAGPPMTIFVSVNNTGFQYQAALPVAAAPANLPRNVVVGQSPAGKALKFVHRGSYDAMDMLYEVITNYLDEHKIERQGLFLEEYVTDPVTTPDDKLVVNVLVLVK
jgi:effector-binding domain-containing protein